jgi:radical SAM modification target selenobiotic family peptide
MDTRDLKKYLAGLGIAGLLSGGSLMAAEASKAGETKSSPKSGETTTVKDTADKPDQPKSG